MTEGTARPAGDAASASGATAGALLRRERLAQGMEIATLATLIKVAPRKLELLEADRLDELHDATFARALAQTVCRTLRVDAAPVMALMPQAGGLRLDQINMGLNTPFRDRPTSVLSRDWSVLAKPVFWAPALIILASVGLYLWPMPGAESSKTVSRVVPSASAPGPGDAASAPAAPLEPVVETVYSAPVQPEAPSGSATVAATVSGLLQLRTSAQSWVEVLDARGQLLLSRVIQPGETVGLDGSLPLKVKIGNSAGTQLTFRGELVDLASHTRENVARLELK